uniref:protein downstream neighbor of Son-like n=1 Tax=Erigeron canadensis TaxID=72917 RepID=UPI001CB91AD0|nr:protein downstream neighbor of Son-like [Erigeron canadensis]
MAKVASRGPVLPVSKVPLFSGGNDGGSTAGYSKTGNGIKRKTPSELRGEQLKRKNVIEIMDESPALEFSSTRNIHGVTTEPTKPIVSKNPRYIDTRVDELFPSRKNNLRQKILPGKENVKENIIVDALKNSSFSLKLPAERQPQSSGPKDTHVSAETTSTKDRLAQSHITSQKCSTSTFRNVVELSSMGEKSSGFLLDMDEGFRGLASRPPPTTSISPTEPSEGNTTKFCAEFQLPGHMTPLDFTLKTSMRVIASSSVTWFHRLMSCGMFNDLEESNCSAAQASNTKSLYSWVYPQSSLPPPVIAALTLSTNGQGQMDFLSKRQLAWEASFSSLYAMLRKNICNLFYVCTGQFVAMFTSSNGSMGSKSVCNAYVSQSTRSLRSLLKEQDISFTMPLCHSKVEQVTKEDLFELSELEKYNLGQTRRTVSLSDVDNSPESFLVFSDINVNGLYDFLLNYRFLLPSLNSYDVPLLYSPVPFKNAALSAPEVKCREVRKIDHMSVPITNEPNQGPASASHYTVEIKDAYLPPWITSRVCDAMMSNGDISFEASFVVEPMSIGLNVGLDIISQKSEAKDKAVDGLHEKSCPFGIKNTVVSHHLTSGFLKGLKYSDDSYTVSLSPV